MAKFCTNCGKPITDEQAVCLNCGVALSHNKAASTSNTVNTNSDAKSKIAAGLFGIFLGSLGVHNFYLGYTEKAVAQLLLTLVGWILCGLGPLAAGIWGLVEGIMILAGSITTDAKGNPLKD